MPHVFRGLIGCRSFRLAARRQELDELGHDLLAVLAVEEREAIEERARSLAQVLARSDDGDLVDVLTYSTQVLLMGVGELGFSDYG